MKNVHDVRHITNDIPSSGDSGKNILEDVSEEIYTNGEYADYDYFNGWDHKEIIFKGIPG